MSKLLGVFLPAALTFLLVGCEQTIPQQRIELSDTQVARLKAVAPVTVQRVSLLDVTCGIHDPENRPGATGYYLTSSGTKMTDDYAKWACGGDNFAYLKCPYMSVKEDAGFAVVDVHQGTVDDYSLGDVERCVTSLIKHAPIDSKPTSEKVRNRDSYGKAKPQQAE